MAIFFRENVGNSMDIFHSLYILANEEQFTKKIINDDKSISSAFLKFINYAKNNCSKDLESIQFFFKEHFDKRHSFTLYYLLVDRVLHEEVESIEDILDGISGDDKELFSIIAERLMEYIKRYSKGIDLETKELNKDSLVELLEGYGLPSEAKWNIYLMLSKPSEYVDRFIALVRNYLPIYKKIINKFSDKKKKFNEVVQKEVKSHGIDYIKSMELFEEPETYDNIYISTITFFYGNVVYDIKDNNLYLYLGIKYKEALDSYRGKNRRDHTINLMKAMGDGSRYEILSILNERDSYGQELAEAMNLSTATISHHMNLLHTLGLVTVEKIDNRMYYRLRKEALKKYIKDFSEDFNL
ncbi:ArsR/SmtB family transcription factor [Alloiococcus sp. CFN-8]|uniref:ArsR/SmtB family transcription factor n=1 Tax=Alloiococcus sp. CFN-8 TaxID=3416081 RepID=UPI003CECCB50